ncbi:T9SS type A sorting domain-containing protein, partial [Fulvivirga sp. RKSG066]|uniref:T9SS type A sorting domain-containing protein n=1 Tax=Fulvivirga aurantia TaxID=2529383 RepID=UPI0012BB855A
RAQVAIWENDGTTEVACNRYVNNDDDVSITALGLTPGNTYYISVDNNYSGYRGTFTLCLTDAADYDFYEGAYEINDLDNWCSADGEFTTIGATGDQNAASCWNTSPNYNRWFKFTAVSSNATIEVQRGGSLGTIRRVNLALFEANGTTEIACARYVNNDDNVSIATSALTPGNTYYISVDNNYSGYRGTFTLCVDNISQTYYSIASGAWNNGSNWSLVSHVGPASGSYPTIGDLARIEGHSMTITSNEDLAEVRLNAASNNTGLTVSNGTLDLDGRLMLTNPGNNFNLNLTFSNSTVNVGNDFTVNRNGGTATVTATISNSSVNISDDFGIFSTAGTGDNTINISTLSNLLIGGELILNNTGGPRSLISVDNSNLTISDNLAYTASADNLVELSLSTGADLYLEGDIQRGSPAYGDLSSSGNSSVHYRGSTPQILATGGSGTGDAITYESLVINNSSSLYPQVSLGGALDFSGTLTLTDGVVLSSNSNLFTFLAGSSVGSGSNSSFIAGPVRKIGDTPFTFQIGENNKWAPLEISNITGDAATEFTAQYFNNAHSDIGSIKSPDPNGDMTAVSSVEYWELDNTGTLSATDLTLHWKDQAASGITDYSTLNIAHYDGAEWENLGQDAIQATDPGSITVTNVASFSPFTFGTTGTNPLPVELLNFEGFVKDEVVSLNWSTASEVNNERFDIQRSVDGVNFETIAAIAGKGDSQKLINYDYTDINPIFGTSYYRLQQVDFDGDINHSPIISVNFEIAEINIHPNPVDEETFRVQLKVGSQGVVKTSIISPDGKVIQSKSFEFEPSSFQEIKMSTEYIPSGIYLLKVNMDNATFIKRLMIK